VPQSFSALDASWWRCVAKGCSCQFEGAQEFWGSSARRSQDKVDDCLVMRCVVRYQDV